MKIKVDPELDKHLLQYALSSDKVDKTDLANTMKKTREEFLKLHNHVITQRKSDGRWTTYLGNKKPYKLIVRVNKKDVEDIVIQYYMDSTHYTTTFAECFKLWMDSQENSLNPSLSPKTLTNYRAEFKRFIQDFPITNFEVVNITEKDVRNYFKALMERPDKITRKRLNSVKALFSGTFNFAKSELDLDTIPIRTVLREIVFADCQFAIEEEKQKIYYQDELQALVDHLRKKNTMVSLGTILAAQTGLRISEIAALKWEHVFPGALHIFEAEHSYTKSDGTRVVEIGLPKKRKKRKVELSKEAEETLALLFEMHPTKTGFIILKDGKRATTRTLDYALRQACKICNIPILSMHKLRSTYASTMLALGCPEKAVQDQLGHVEITTTQKHYNFNPYQKSERNAIFREKSIFIK